MSYEYAKGVGFAAADRKHSSGWRFEEARRESRDLCVDQARDLVAEFGVRAEYLHYCATARVDPVSATIDSAMLTTMARWIAPFHPVGALTHPRLRMAIKWVRADIENARKHAATTPR